MTDDERQAELDLMDWQIEGFERELARIAESGEDAPGQYRTLAHKLADLKARVQEWRAPRSWG
jgi:hypothetical protein